MSIEKSVVLLTSTEPDKNRNFGSGFLVAQDATHSYVLTCAHVVKQIGHDKLKVADLSIAIEVLPDDSDNQIDMALLKVEGLLDKPVLAEFALGEKDSKIQIVGHRLFDNQHEKRKLDGTLGKGTSLTAKDYPLWDVSIQDDSFSTLEGGYSGSPLCNQQGQVIGVVSHRRSEKMGHAFCISNLKVLYPQIIELLPYLDEIEKPISIQKEKTRKGIEALYALPYLLDRAPQESVLIKTIKDYQTFEQPLICIIRGKREDCADDKFAQRIASNILPKFSNVDICVSNHKQIQVEDCKSEEHLIQRTHNSLAEAFSCHVDISMEKICLKISQLNKPFVLYQSLTADECYAGVNTLHHFLKFWRETFRLPSGHRHLVLVCLFFHQQEPQKKWFNFYRNQNRQNEIEQALTTLPSCVVLDPLDLITEVHLQKWAQSHSVKEYFGRDIYGDVGKWLKEQNYTFGNGVRLEDLAYPLTDFLKKLAQEVPR